MTSVLSSEGRGGSSSSLSSSSNNNIFQSSSTTTLLLPEDHDEVTSSLSPTASPPSSSTSAAADTVIPDEFTKSSKTPRALKYILVGIGVAYVALMMQALHAWYRNRQEYHKRIYDTRQEIVAERRRRTQRRREREVSNPTQRSDREGPWFLDDIFDYHAEGVVVDEEMGMEQEPAQEEEEDDDDNCHDTTTATSTIIATRGRYEQIIKRFYFQKILSDNEIFEGNLTLSSHQSTTTKEEEDDEENPNVKDMTREEED